MSAVCFDGVRKSFGARVVLDGLNLSIPPRAVYGLLGPNGSGKSTALNILCNLLDPDAGAVSIGGAPASSHAQRALGVCPQEIALYRDLYPAENLAFFADIYGLSGPDRTRRIAELMHLFGLEPYARTKVSALSGGWQSRVNFAVALVHSPEVLVLDEPTAAVDLEARHELWRLIKTLKAGGMTILLTTHHLDEAEQLCSRIGILSDGRVVHEGTVSELLSLVPAQAIAMVEANDEQAVLERARSLGWGVRDYAGKMGCLLPRQLSLREVVEAFSDVDVSSVSVQRVSLEHAYLEVLHRATELY